MAAAEACCDPTSRELPPYSNHTQEEEKGPLRDQDNSRAPVNSSQAKDVVESCDKCPNDPEVVEYLGGVTPVGDRLDISRSCTPVSEGDSGYDIRTTGTSLSSLADVSGQTPDLSTVRQTPDEDGNVKNLSRDQTLDTCRWPYFSSLLTKTNSSTPLCDHFQKEAASPDMAFQILHSPLTPPEPPGNDWASNKVPCDRRSLDSGVYDSSCNVIILNIPSEKLPDKDPPKENGKVEGDHLNPPSKNESIWIIAISVFIPFLIAGYGTCGAGLVLDEVKEWQVFRSVSALFIVVPTLLGLKGNLEMTLASRVSTQANMGYLDSAGQYWRIIWGNISLKQCQATVLSFLASLFAVLISFIKDGKFDLHHSLLLGASSLATAVIASFVLGSITLSVVILSHKWHINPDNVATPIAASLGDITTLGLLSGISSGLFIHKHLVTPSVAMIVGFLIFIPLWVFLASRNEYVNTVLFAGWIPVMLAVVIATFSGFILEIAESRFPGLPVFQPVINGVGGNLVAVQASRISTFLHQRGTVGQLPPEDPVLCSTPWGSFFGKGPHSRISLILMAMVIPGHLIFAYSITWIKRGDTALTPSFLPLYLLAAVLQVAILLYTADIFIHCIWHYKIDPDNAVIPILTALGDFFGTALLTIAFYVYELIT